MQEILIGNIRGPKGDPGTGITILGYFATTDELSAAITNPNVGDCYGVGSEHPYDIYIYSTEKGWVNNGSLQGVKGDRGEQGVQGIQGIPGEKGKDGTNATITGVTASVDGTTGAPSVTVTMEGTDTERSFNFSFSGLKGEKGEKGDLGSAGTNVDINEQSPSYIEAETLENLSSGEKISLAFGKIKKAIKEFIAHKSDSVGHITSDERTAWNGKAPGGHGLGSLADGGYAF